MSLTDLSMREKLAVALMTAGGVHPGAIYSAFHRKTGMMAGYLTAADAVLATIREPTEAMWRALSDDEPTFALHNWQAMIDAAGD